MGVRLDGKVAIVTGGAQGLGLAIVRRFLAEGAKVAVVDITASPEGSLALTADLTASGIAATVVTQTQETLGSIDILVNCHGVCVTQPMDAIDPTTWQRTFDVNVQSTFFLIQEVAKSMKSGGAIVNLASNSAFLPKPEQVDYAASKAAIVSLTRSVAAALGPKGIRANAIAPGVIPTPMTEGIAQARAEIRGSTKEEMLEMFAPLTALKRLGTPDEVAKVAVFLASDDSSYVTGQTLEVCGGLLMR